MILILFFLTQHFLSLFPMSYYDHRVLSHKQFILSPRAHKFWHYFAAITEGSSYLSPIGFAIMHMLHHLHADTEKDPHSPKYYHGFLGPFKMMWDTKRIYDQIKKGAETIEIRGHQIDLREIIKKVDCPNFEKFERVAHSKMYKVIWILLVASFYAFYLYHHHSHPWIFPIVGLMFLVQIVMAPVHGLIINYLGHVWGEQRYEMENTSRNLPWIISFLMLGEGWHNDHHKYPGRSNFGKWWYELDLVHQTTKLFTLLKLHKPATQMQTQTD